MPLDIFAERSHDLAIQGAIMSPGKLAQPLGNLRRDANGDAGGCGGCRFLIHAPIIQLKQVHHERTVLLAEAGTRLTAAVETAQLAAG
jgi:hypothetical protein